MHRHRSFLFSLPAAVVTTLLGSAMLSCRPAADPVPELRIAVRTQPRGAQVGIPLGTPPVIEVLDPDSELITRTDLTVRAAVVAGDAEITTGGEADVVGGVASFSDMVLIGSNNANIQLAFQLIVDAVPNEAIAASDTFRLATGPATLITPVTSIEFTGEAGQLVTPAPAVLVVDAGGNIVSGATVEFFITAGEGRISGASEAISNAQGIATVSGWALGLPGQNRLLAIGGLERQVTFTAAVTTTAGMLRLRVTGSPTGSTAQLRVRKTSAAGAVHDATYNVQDSLTVTGLPFGTYQVSGDSIKVGSRIWQADGAPSNLNVSTTSGPSIAINYREYGRFEVTARGLPTPNQTATLDFLPTAGESAVSFSTTVVNDAVTRGLGAVGTYDVVPRTVVVGGQQFTATPARQSVVLAGGDAMAQMTFNYAVTTGSLTITLAGTLPQGAAPQVDLTGPGGFRETVFLSGNRTWTGLAPGNYTIVASPITVGGTVFNPTPPNSVVAVAAGATAQLTITYNP